MKIDFIENNGPDNLRDTLKAFLPRSSNVYISVAFVTQSGLDEIVQSLRQVASNGKVHLITGLYQKVTEPRALKSLLRIQTDTRGSFSVRLSREPLFHRKLYLLRNRKRMIILIGSSNLTSGGLRSGGELNLMLSVLPGSISAKKVMQSFEDDWKHRSVPLSVKQIEEYEKARPEQPIHDNYTKGQLAKILGTDTSHREADDEEKKDCNYYRDCFRGIVKKKTEKVVSQETDWDDKDYWWFSTGGINPYQKWDRIIFFDFNEKKVQIVEVKDKANIKVNTPDGRHFVAYKPVYRISRRFSKMLWAALEQEEINPRKAKDRRKLSVEKAMRIKGLLKQRKKRKKQ